LRRGTIPIAEPGTVEPARGILRAMLPQFIPPGSPHLLMGTAMAAVHDLEGMAWFTAIICAAGFARTWLNRDAVRRAMDALTGTVLVAFGIDLALSRR
jgi:threonine/homoserine/homoserine lactone efflux protein